MEQFDDQTKEPDNVRHLTLDSADDKIDDQPNSVDITTHVDQIQVKDNLLDQDQILVELANQIGYNIKKQVLASENVIYEPSQEFQELQKQIKQQAQDSIQKILTDVLEANNIKDDFGMANVIHILSEPVLEDLKGAIDEQIQRSFTNYANIDFDNLIDTFETSTNGIPNQHEINKYQETCQINGGCIKPIQQTIDIETEDIVSYINMGDKINLDNYPQIGALKEGQITDIVYAGEKNLKMFTQEGTLYIIDPDSIGFKSDIDFSNSQSLETKMFLANLKYMTVKQLEEQELRMMTNQGQLHDTSSFSWAIQDSDKALLPYQEMQLQQIEDELTQMQARLEQQISQLELDNDTGPR